ncbi:MAG: hypothetical protein AAB516_00330 [Patescibacteria group bacterium]
MAEKIVVEVKEENPFVFLVRSMLQVEKLRVATQVRQTHLKLQARVDLETDKLLERIDDLEKYADERIASLIKSHPAYPWFSRVKGVGKENIGKVIGLVDIEKANTISALWKFAGYHVDNGKAPKRVKGGGKLGYNSQLRSMCWRLASSLLKGQGKFYKYYLVEKGKYQSRFISQGMKIVPASQLSRNNGKKQETEGKISEGHIHNMALRKMIKLFLACLWLEWRKAEGLSTRSPYSHEYQGHTTMISPEEMVDR